MNLKPSTLPGGPPANGAHVPRHLGLARVVIAAAQLMIVPDAAIVNVALPQMQRALGFSGAGLEWIDRRCLFAGLWQPDAAWRHSHDLLSAVK